MSTPTGIALRLTRCGAFALSAATLAFGGHLAGGGGLPAPQTLLLTVLSCAAAGWVLSRARRGPVAVLGVLVVLQYGLHRLFDGRPGPPSPADSMSGMPMPPGHAGLGMLLGHAASVLITGLLLARGEQALWALLGLLAGLRLLPRFPAAVPLGAEVRPPVRYRPVPRRRRPVAVSQLRRRGPPPVPAR